MNKKKIFLCLLILIVVSIVVIGITANRITIDNKTNQKETNVQQAKIEERTIIRTLTNSMEVTSGLTEKVELRVAYYFKELCTEQNTYIKEGENILKYTNGTYLVAPYDCILKSSNLPKEGEICTYSHYIELQTTETLSTVISVNENDMAHISLGKIVEVTINTFESAKYEGYVTDISEIATDSKFNVTVTFINDGRIKLGMSGYITIILQEEKDVMSVPIESIYVKENKKYVDIKNEEGIVESIEIETGISDANYVQIKM